VERDYQDFKEKIGLDHFEGRSRRGFRCHVTLCAAAHAFLSLNRALFPPERQTLDLADGATAPPARAPPPHRLVPALPTTRRRRHAAAWALKNVIE